MSKYHNVGIDYDRIPATKRQRDYVTFLTKGKTSTANLTRAKADELITRHKKKLGDKPIVVQDNACFKLDDPMIRAIFNSALQAANKAGAEWLKKHPSPSFYIYNEETDEETPVHGAIGRSVLLWPNQRTIFGRWLKRNMFDGQYNEVPFPHDYAERWEGDLHRECIEAAKKVFASYRICLKARHDMLPE